MSERAEWTNEERRVAQALWDEPAEWTEECYDPDDLIGLIEQGGAFPGAARVLTHIATCAYCRREYATLRETLAAARVRQMPQQPDRASEPASTPAPEQPAPPSPAPAPAPEHSLWQRFLMAMAIPQRRMALATGLAVVLCGVVIFNAVRIRRAGQNEQTDSVVRLQNKNPRPDDTHPPRETQIARADADLVAKVRKDGLQIPEFRVGSTQLLGGDSPASTPPELISPLATAVVEARPTFRWKPISGASGYIVTVILQGQDGRIVAESKTFPGTEWTPGKDLERGQKYLWQVKAITKQGQPVSADAEFGILSEKEAAAFTRPTSFPLAQGIRYAQAGLLDKAEQEFRKVPRGNPDYATAQQFLRQIEEKRPHN